MSASRERSANTSDSDDEEPLTKAKLFALGDSGSWAEMGVGVAWVAEVPSDEEGGGVDGGGGGYMTLNISSLDEKGVVNKADLLMSTPVMPDEEYKVQRNSILLWSDPRLDGKDMAISFHSRAGCDHIVDSITAYQQSIRDARAVNQNNSNSSTSPSGSGTAEQADPYYQQSDNDFATASSSGSSPTGTMRRTPSSNNGSSGTSSSPSGNNNRVTGAGGVGNNNNGSPQQQQRMLSGNGGAAKNGSIWEVTKANLPMLAESSMTGRHRFGCEVRDRRNFVYDLCNLFVLSVHEGDVQSIDFICNIVVNCLTCFAAEVQVVTQFVEEKTVEAVIDVVQFYLGRRTRETGFVSRTERQLSFRNPANFPPWLVSRVHYFYAIQYLRDLIPNKLEPASEGDQSLVNLFLLRARLNMVQELIRRPPPPSPEGNNGATNNNQQEQDSTPVRGDSSAGGSTVPSGSGVAIDDDDDDDETTQTIPPNNASSSLIAEEDDPDRSILETAMQTTRSIEGRRGVAALIHDITYNIKFNAAYGIDVRNDVFSNLVKCGTLDFLTGLLRDELSDALKSSSSSTTSNSSSAISRLPSSASSHHTHQQQPRRGRSTSRATSSRGGGGAGHHSSSSTSESAASCSTQSVRLIADIVSHVAVWAPSVVCNWLLENAKKPIVMPVSSYRMLLAPPPPLPDQASSSTTVAAAAATSSYITPPRSPVCTRSGTTAAGDSEGPKEEASEVKRERTVSVRVTETDVGSMEPASPLDESSSLGTAGGSGGVAGGGGGALESAGTGGSSLEQQDEAMSPTVQHHHHLPPPPQPSSPSGTTTELKLHEGVSPSPMSSSSSREPTTPHNGKGPPSAPPSTLTSHTTTPTAVSSSSAATKQQQQQPQGPLGRSLLFLLVESLGIVTSSVALQALVDACIACGIGLVQNSAAPSLFGPDVASLRARILQYWITGSATTTNSGGLPLPSVYVPLFHALKAATFDASTAFSFAPGSNHRTELHEATEVRCLQSLRLLRTLGREKALIASVPFFNAVKESGLVRSMRAYFEACRASSSSQTRDRIMDIKPPVPIAGEQQQQALPKVTSPSPVTTGQKRARTEEQREEESLLPSVGDSPLATTQPPLTARNISLHTTVKEVETENNNSVKVSSVDSAGVASPPSTTSVVISKQLLSAMCAFLGVLISFNTEEVDNYLIKSELLDSMIAFRRSLRPGGSMVTAGILSVFATMPTAFREGRERPSSSSHGGGGIVPSSIADITRSPYVSTIENSNQYLGSSLSGVMPSGSSVLLAHVHAAFEEYLLREAPLLLRAIARALEGKLDDDVCSSVSNVSSFYTGAAGQANQEAFEAELAVLASEGGLLSEPPIPGVGDLNGGSGSGGDEDSLGLLSVDDVVIDEDVAADEDEDGCSNRSRSRSSSSSSGSSASQGDDQEENAVKDEEEDITKPDSVVAEEDESTNVDIAAAAVEAATTTTTTTPPAAASSVSASPLPSKSSPVRPPVESSPTTDSPVKKKIRSEEEAPVSPSTHATVAPTANIPPPPSSPPHQQKGILGSPPKKKTTK